MADSYCLAIDAMGGDFGPRVTVPATCDFLSATPTASAVLLGDQSAVEHELSSYSLPSRSTVRTRVTIVHCDENVAMNEKPTDAIRNKRGSSLRRGLDMLAAGEADAFVSAGNTGALVAMSVMGIGTLAGMVRPAICTAIPTQRGFAYLLDMGANPVCSAEQLHQFARIATRLYCLVENKDKPRVGLLNIGVEEIKGTREILDAAELFRADGELNYIGFIEGDGLFAGNADIVVCDGFSGNIALKSVEGVARMIMAMLKSTLQRGFLTRIGALLMAPAFKTFKQKVDPGSYNGACLLGLNKVVIKSHGGASRAAFERAIHKAAVQVEQRLPEKLSAYLT